MLSKSLMIALGSLALSAAPSFAISFTTSVGVQSANVGTITLTQKNANTVTVFLDLLDGYGILNTGNDNKTPFAFNLSGSKVGLSATFVTPSGGAYTSGQFSLNANGGGNSPYGDFTVAIDSTAKNGGSDAYFGDLKFDLTRTGGLTLAAFIANAQGAYFSADLINQATGATGAQAWSGDGNPPPSVPDSGSTLVLLGSALSGLGFMASRRKMAKTV